VSDIENNPMTTENDRVAADEPSNLYRCSQCTAAYAPDVPACPHCGASNTELGGVERTDDVPSETQQPETEQAGGRAQRRALRERLRDASEAAAEDSE